MGRFGSGFWRVFFEENKIRRSEKDLRRNYRNGGGKDAFIVSALIGFLTGVLASMGLGGGFVLVVWLTLFENVTQRAAQGINLLFFLPIALISLILHLKNNLVNKIIVKKLALGGLLGAIIGTYGSQLIDNSLLRKLFALFLLAFGLRELFSKSAGAAPSSSTQQNNP